MILKMAMLILATLGPAWPMMLPLNGQVVCDAEGRSRPADKTGTKREWPKDLASQVQVANVLARAGSLEAERAGFEPAREQAPYRFSRPAHSATLAPLR
jgi:hypothetical protein